MTTLTNCKFHNWNGSKSAAQWYGGGHSSLVSSQASSSGTASMSVSRSSPLVSPRSSSSLYSATRRRLFLNEIERGQINPCVRYLQSTHPSYTRRREAVRLWWFAENHPALNNFCKHFLGGVSVLVHTKQSFLLLDILTYERNKTRK